MNLEVSCAEVAVKSIVLHPQVLIELPEVGKLDRLTRSLRFGVGLSLFGQLFADWTSVFEESNERSLQQTVI